MAANKLIHVLKCTKICFMPFKRIENSAEITIRFCATLKALLAGGKNENQT